MTRNPNDALVRDHLARHPELALQMAPTARAPKLSPFALAAAPGDREVIAAREARHHIECACAAAGVHPSARPDVEVVRPSQVGA